MLLGFHINSPLLPSLLRSPILYIPSCPFLSFRSFTPSPCCPANSLLSLYRVSRCFAVLPLLGFPVFLSFFSRGFFVPPSFVSIPSLRPWCSVSFPFSYDVASLGRDIGSAQAWIWSPCPVMDIWERSKAVTLAEEPCRHVLREVEPWSIDLCLGV